MLTEPEAAAFAEAPAVAPPGLALAPPEADSPSPARAVGPAGGVEPELVEDLPVDEGRPLV